MVFGLALLLMERLGDTGSAQATGSVAEPDAEAVAAKDR
jgi:hypothetical protein